ncbi:MAG: hypothetical protein A3F41_03965 [Coxiella sp. RIFCSPHIGHO2_12_FULL_44_14]|nr:MAG: hypothetical protein A3F41_03965 [Coxiella sp. RIFCSPHIGHO2_12_FULL_44_14]
MSKECAKLSAINFGLASGITWALGVLILGWVGWLSGWGLRMVDVFASVYWGFTPTFWGTIVGAIWAFVDFFIGGLILAAIYNACSACGKGCSMHSKEGGTTI